MTNNINQRRFLRRCALFIILSLFLTLINYGYFESIIKGYNYYFKCCYARCNKYISNLLLDTGFTVDNIIITGNKLVDKKSILNLVDTREPILYIQLERLAYDIKHANKLIKNVRIYRFLPNTIHVEVEEYQSLLFNKNFSRLNVTRKGSNLYCSL